MNGNLEPMLNLDDAWKWNHNVRTAWRDKIKRNSMWDTNKRVMKWMLHAAIEPTLKNCGMSHADLLKFFQCDRTQEDLLRFLNLFYSNFCNEACQRLCASCANSTNKPWLPLKPVVMVQLCIVKPLELICTTFKDCGEEIERVIATMKELDLLSKSHKPSSTQVSEKKRMRIMVDATDTSLQKVPASHICIRMSPFTAIARCLMAKKVEPNWVLSCDIVEALTEAQLIAFWPEAKAYKDANRVTWITDPKVVVRDSQG